MLIKWFCAVRREMRLKKIWKNKIRHKNVKYEVRRGAGYYIPRLGKSPKGYLFDIEMKSGKVAVCRLTEIKYFSDPWDMVEESWYTFEGYKGEKMVIDCSFEEFKKIYGGTFYGKA